VEHAELVSDDWTRVGGHCLTCDDCERFTLTPEEAEAREACVAAV
jgi:hypothetical protein